MVERDTRPLQRKWSLKRSTRLFVSSSERCNEWLYSLPTTHDKKIDQTDAPPLLYRMIIYTKKEKEAIPPSRGHYTMQEQMRKQCPLATRGDPLLTTPLKLKQRHLTSTMRGMVLNPYKAISPDFNQ